MTERITLTVEDGVGELLAALAGGERKRGAWLSEQIRVWHETQARTVGSDVEALRMQVLGLAGNVKALEGRLLHVERYLSAMIASNAEHGTSAGIGASRD